MTNTFSSEEFDRWAPVYDSDVHSTGFPFSGYEKTLDQIIKIAMPKPKMKILDLGVGTGNLTTRFLNAGCIVTGIDYSLKMIEVAKSKFPAVMYFQADLRSEPSQIISGMKFDRIVSAYTFHHFSLPEKYLLLRNFIPYLSEHGFFVIGDIAFHNNAGMQACKESAGGDWDDEEYWLEDQSISFLTQMHMHVGFTQTSDFSGVFKIVVSTDLPMH